MTATTLIIHRLMLKQYLLGKDNSFYSLFFIFSIFYGLNPYSTNLEIVTLCQVKPLEHYREKSMAALIVY